MQYDAYCDWYCELILATNANKGNDDNDDDNNVNNINYKYVEKDDYVCDNSNICGIQIYCDEV